MATIDDVAKAAQVSTSTVSYVLSGKRPISAPTKARVEKAIKELGYRPHAGARALASSQTNVLALIAPLRAAVNVNVIMQFVTGVVQAARSYEYDVLLLTQEDAGGIDRVANGSMVDAVIAMDVEEDDERIPALQAARQPAILIGLPRDSGGLSCVDLDFHAAGTQAVRHLAALGHKHIGLLGSDHAVWERHTSFLERLLTGARSEATQRKVELTALPCASSEVGAKAAVDELFEQSPRITGIVVHNEQALPHIMARLRELSLSVPEEISVVALCPQDIALAQPIPLTSVDLPAVSIGRAAVEMAMSRLSSEQPAETRLVAAVLTERGTTAPAHKRSVRVTRPTAPDTAATATAQAPAPAVPAQAVPNDYR